MLDVIRERQVQQIGLPALEQRNSGIEHEQRQVRRIHIRPRASDHRLDLGAGAFGRKADAGEISPEQLAQFVFRRDCRGPDAGAGHQCEDRLAAHQFVVGHHDLAAGFAIEAVIAGDAVHRRRRAGHDRDIVRVGEGRHDSIGGAEKAVAAERADRRKDAVRDAALEVFGIAPVDADDHGRMLRFAVTTGRSAQSSQTSALLRRELSPGTRWSARARS